MSTMKQQIRKLRLRLRQSRLRERALRSLLWLVLVTPFVAVFGTIGAGLVYFVFIHIVTSLCESASEPIGKFFRFLIGG